MPVFAVAAAVVAIGVAVEVGTTLAIIAAVGATIGAIGAVTGSKELMIAGGIVGAIGGIGALASSAGIFGSAATLGEVAAGTTAAETASPFGAASGIDAEIAQWSSYGAEAAGAGAGAGSSALSGAPTIGAASPTIDNTMDVVNTVNGNVSTTGDTLGSATANATAPDVVPTAATDAGVPNTQMAGQESVDASGQVVQGDTGTGINPPAAPKAPDAPGVDPKTGSILSGGQGVTGNPAPGATVTGSVNPLDAGIPGSYDAAQKAASLYGTVKAPAAGASDPSIWSKVADFATSSGGGRLISGALQGGMSFLSGATNGLTPAQIAALNAQAEANQAAANLSRMQQANMSGNLPVASRTATVRSPAVTGAPTPVGMINQPPQGAA